MKIRVTSGNLHEEVEVPDGLPRDGWTLEAFEQAIQQHRNERFNGNPLVRFCPHLDNHARCDAEDVYASTPAVVKAFCVRIDQRKEQAEAYIAQQRWEGAWFEATLNLLGPYMDANPKLTVREAVPMYWRDHGGCGDADPIAAFQSLVAERCQRLMEDGG